MRTRQGTAWGFEDDGFRRERGCEHEGCLGDPFPASRKELQAGVHELLGPGKPNWLWLTLPYKLKGRLCVVHAIEWREKLERWYAEAKADDICGECAGLRGTHEMTCSKKR